jgi:hypothetical protein
MGQSKAARRGGGVAVFGTTGRKEMSLKSGAHMSARGKGRLIGPVGSLRRRRHAAGMGRHEGGWAS